MLRIWRASGEELTALAMDELPRLTIKEQFDAPRLTAIQEQMTLRERVPFP